MILGQITIPSELLGVIAAASLGAVTWQVKVTIDMRKELAVLGAKVEEIFRHCKRCR